MIRANLKKSRSSRFDSRIAVLLLLIGFAAGVLMDPVSYSNGQVTYRFAPSVPFGQEAKERIATEVLEKTNTEWDPDGNGCTIRFEDNDDFSEIIIALTDIENHENSMAFIMPEPCRIYFNAWYFPYTLVGQFIETLIHEIGHAWDIEHNEDRRSIFHFEKLPGQRLLMSDRFALWIAQQRSLASQ